MKNKTLRLMSGLMMVIFCFCLCADINSLSVFAVESLPEPEVWTLEKEDEYYRDNPDTAEAVEVLTELDLIVNYADGTFRPMDNITRAEMTVVIIRLVGLSGIAQSYASEELFADVPSEHWAYGNINLAYHLGLINGYVDKSFRPDDFITYNQAVKILVSSLGYDKLAQINGGYPMGYLSLANQKGILKNALSSDGEQFIDRAMMAKLVYNALDVNVLEIDLSDYEVTLKEDNDNTLLSKYNRIHKSEGIITANTISAVNDAGYQTAYDIEITSEGVTSEYIFEEGKNFDYLSDLLGMRVEYYYRENPDNNKKILLYIKVSDENKTVMVDAENISDATTSSVFEYYKAGETSSRTSRIKIYEGANVIYNRKYIGYKAHSLEKEKLMPKSGSVALADTDSDGMYDLVSITDYRAFVIDSINITDGKIYDKCEGAPVSLFDKYGEKISDIIKNGESVKIEDLKEWDVLAVAQSADGEYVKAEVVGESAVRGTVTGKSDESIFINNIEYDISQSVQKGSIYDPQKIKINDEGVFYVDIDGKIAAFDAQDVSTKYAFLMGVGANETDFDTTVKLKLLDEDGTVKVYETAERVSVDGRKNLTKDEIKSIFNTAGISGTGKRGEGIYQVISYRLNVDGYVSTIDTTCPDAVWDEDSLTLDIDDDNCAKVTGSHEHGDAYANGIYYTASRTFAPSSGTTLSNSKENGASTPFRIDDNTKIFRIPIEGKNLNLDSEPDYNFSVVSPASLSNGSRHLVSAYSVSSETGIAKVLLLKAEKNTVNSAYKAIPSVVSNVSKTLDSDGNEALMIEYYESRVLKKSVCSESTTVTLLRSSVSGNPSIKLDISYIRSGDVIFYAKNARGEFSTIAVVFPRNKLNASDSSYGQIGPDPEPAWISGLADAYVKAYCQVYSKEGTVIKIKAENIYDLYGRPAANEFPHSYYDIASAVVYVFDVKKQELTLGSADDIITLEQGGEDCYIFINLLSYSADTVVVYKY